VSDVKYYIIDFGFSGRFSKKPGELTPMTTGIRGHYPAPEMRGGYPYDPLRCDVYALGAVFLEVIEFYEGWDVDNVKRWIKMMMTENPENRMTAEEALEECEALIKTFPPAELEKPIRPKELAQRRDTLSPAELYYTFKARYMGNGTVKQELYENLEMKDKQPSLAKRQKSISRLLSALRSFLS